jgi:glycosyltransferase involved in cell wall biosynthesis
VKKVTLSVVLATYNEEENIAGCLESIKDIADEIVIVDGRSLDTTATIAKNFGAKVIEVDNKPMFHINKQKALDEAEGDWILQLDADERVSKGLAEEIIHVIGMNQKGIEIYEKHLPHKTLFFRHQKLLEARDGKIGTGGDYTAFFIPRLNFFLGKYLRFGGVYPDGVIRLVKRGKAHFPCKDIHEQITVKGKVGWLQHPLYHKDSPTFKRYIERNKRYISLLAQELEAKKTHKSPVTMIKYMLVLPLWWFGLTYVRHKGFLDGWQGLVFSLFSSLRFPRAYWRYIKSL